MTDDSSADREFFRVTTTIPLRATPVGPDDYHRNANEILSRIDPPLPDVDVALIGWLDRIERKLDRLLGHQGLTETKSLEASDRKSVELSGSGMSFSSDETNEPGNALLLEFELPETPIRVVRCMGRVVEETESLRGRVGVAFETIRQSDRDAIVRYTLAVQRQQIRGRGAAES